MSDHNPLVLEMTLSQPPQMNYTWSFERALLLDPQYVNWIQTWIPLFMLDTLGSAPIGAVWDTLKACLCGEATKYSFERQKNDKVLTEQLYTGLTNAELKLVEAISLGDSPDEALLEVVTARARITEISIKKAADKYLAWWEKAYEFKEKIGQQLAFKTRRSITRDQISEIRDPLSCIRSDQAGIRTTFQQFYQHLYSKATNQDLVDIGNYLLELGEETLSAKDREALICLLRLMRYV